MQFITDEYAVAITWPKSEDTINKLANAIDKGLECEMQEAINHIRKCKTDKGVCIYLP